MEVAIGLGISSDFIADVEDVLTNELLPPNDNGPPVEDVGVINVGGCVVIDGFEAVGLAKIGCCWYWELCMLA